MSSKWKLPFQKPKRERQQPEARSNLGILEKKKDYIQRAMANHKKEEEIQKLRREAALKNPNEFYFSMITDNKKQRKDFEDKPTEKPLSGFSKEQKLLIETRDKTYVQSKIQSQKHKIERIKRQLPAEKSADRIKIYMSVEEALAAQAEKTNPEPEEREEIRQLRDELKQRLEIVRKLEEVYEVMDGGKAKLEDESESEDEPHRGREKPHPRYR